MKKFFDKLSACWIILTSNEYAVYTTKSFTNANGSNCWLSYGITNKENGSLDFLEVINEYNNKLINS